MFPVDEVNQVTCRFPRRNGGLIHTAETFQPGLIAVASGQGLADLQHVHPRAMNALHFVASWAGFFAASLFSLAAYSRAYLTAQATTIGDHSPGLTRCRLCASASMWARRSPAVAISPFSKAQASRPTSHLPHSAAVAGVGVLPSGAGASGAGSSAWTTAPGIVSVSDSSSQPSPQIDRVTRRLAFVSLRISAFPRASPLRPATLTTPMDSSVRPPGMVARAVTT